MIEESAKRQLVKKDGGESLPQGINKGILRARISQNAFVYPLSKRLLAHKTTDYSRGIGDGDVIVVVHIGFIPVSDYAFA